LASNQIYFLFACDGGHSHHHSFPTRRSSDLEGGTAGHDHDPPDAAQQLVVDLPQIAEVDPHSSRGTLPDRLRDRIRLLVDLLERSAEHTYKLQSPCNLVCRLLLEKKKG